MSDTRSRWNSDAHLRSETETADLAPYVSQSAIDAVRDAFRKIVLENQDHSEVLDKLLPPLQHEPSRRSESLDWLDDELSRMSDDAIIELIDRLKRPGSRALQPQQEPGASEPGDARPPGQPATTPRRRLGLAGTAVVGLACLFITSYGWATATRDYRAEALQNEGLRAEVDAVRIDLQELVEANSLIGPLIDKIVSGEIDDPAAFKPRIDEWLRRVDERVKSLEVPR